MKLFQNPEGVQRLQPRMKSRVDEMGSPAVRDLPLPGGANVGDDDLKRPGLPASKQVGLLNIEQNAQVCDLPTAPSLKLQRSKAGRQAQRKLSRVVVAGYILLRLKLRSTRKKKYYACNKEENCTKEKQHDQIKI